MSSLGFVPGEVTTGACVGVDTYAARRAIGLWPDSLHRIVVPADRSRVAPDWWTDFDHVVVDQMAPGTTYRDRNVRVVHNADIVLAFPLWGEHDVRASRSGTWQTVRFARRSKLEVIVVELEAGGPDA
ncbi:MAG: hypothetical protein ACYCS4_07865 [Acidimicrobiales bacterium]